MNSTIVVIIVAVVGIVCADRLGVETQTGTLIQKTVVGYFDFVHQLAWRLNFSR